MDTNSVMGYTPPKDLIIDDSYTDPLKPLNKRLDEEYKDKIDTGFVGTKEEYKMVRDYT